MKSFRQLLVIGFALMLILSSCTLEKRIHMSGFHFEWNNTRQNSNKTLLSTKAIVKQKPIDNEAFIQIKNEGKSNNLESNENHELITSSIENTIPPIIIPNAFVEKISGNYLPEECDNIILTNGDEMKVKVIEIAINDIKYKKCENIDGPLYSIKKSEVFMIKYPNGTKDIITPYNSSVSKNERNKHKNEDGEKKGGVFSILSFCISITGIFIASLILGAGAIVFGIIGLLKEKRRGLAIAGLIIGIIDFVFGLIMIALSI